VDRVIVVRNLWKHYGETAAVKGISFTVHAGEIFGFLGPNGAGKTTTINLLTGLARPDPVPAERPEESTELFVCGINLLKHPRAVQHLLGVVPDENNLYPELSGYENLCFWASLYGIRKKERQERARELLNTVNLTEVAREKFANYSRGLKRRLAIAAALVHRPGLLFLDEPTTGLDVAAARSVRRLITQLHQAGTTIFLTTHYLEEAERLCQRLAFIVSGRLGRIDTVSHLLEPVQGKQFLEVLCGPLPPHFQEVFSRVYPEVSLLVAGPGRFQVEVSPRLKVPALVQFLETEGVEVLEVKRKQASLEDVFVEITGIEAAAIKQEKAKGLP